MKKIALLYISALLLGLTTFSQDYPKQQMKSDLENGIVNLVASIKIAVPELPQTYEEFKLKLIGSNNLSSITQEGDDLLKATYDFIKNKASTSQIKAQGITPMAKALDVVLSYEKDNGFSGPKLEKGSVYLFGGDAASLLDYKAAADKCGDYRDCKWFQIGCHMHNVGVWICTHQETIKAIAALLTAVHLFF